MNSKRTEYCKANPEKRLLWAATRRAKDQALPFDLVEEDIIIPTHCPYLGIELTHHAPRGTNRGSVCSLDRIIPELGYVKGNVEVISHKANSMKQWSNTKELLLFAKHVLMKFDENTVSGR